MKSPENKGHPKEAVLDEEGFRILAKLAGIPQDVVERLLKEADDEDDT